MKEWLISTFGNSRDFLSNFRPYRGGGKRVLINEILSLQIMITAIIGALRDHWPITYPFAYTFQCLLVIAILWRYRALLPELNAP